MSKVKLSINSAKNGFTVEGSENNYYPYDGQLFFPFNSVIVVMDESDIITFRSTTNYDVLFSGKIGYIDITNPIENSIERDLMRRDLSINAIENRWDSR